MSLSNCECTKWVCLSMTHTHMQACQIHSSFPTHFYLTEGQILHIASVVAPFLSTARVYCQDTSLSVPPLIPRDSHLQTFALYNDLFQLP